MKFLGSLVLLLALGLSAASSLDFGEDGVDANTQGFMDHVLEDGFEEDEIVDMDDALEKARMLKSMAKMVAKAEAMDLVNPKKRSVDDADTQGFMDHVMEDGFEEDEIVDMDDALEKARMLKAMAKMVAEAEAMDLMNPKKRFIGSFFSKVKDAIVKAAKKVGNFFKGAWEKAKTAFHKVIHALNFKATVHKLIPYIHSGATVAICTTALTAAASAVLGPFAPLASVVAGPLCNAALSKLESLAG